MPNAPHQIVVTLLGEQPELLGLRCETVLGRPLPPNLRLADSTLRLGDPVEVRPDLVLESEESWVFVEAQGQIDTAKARRWPLAMALKANQTQRAGDLVVLTFSRAVTEWAARVCDAEGPLGTRTRVSPVVLLLTGEVAERLLDEDHPELAFFAAWAVHQRHGREAQHVVRRAIELSKRLPDPLLPDMRRSIYNVLSAKMLSFLREATMNVEDIPQSRAMRNFILKTYGPELAKAEAKGKAESILAVFRARRVPGLGPAAEAAAFHRQQRALGSAGRARGGGRLGRGPLRLGAVLA